MKRRVVITAAIAMFIGGCNILEYPLYVLFGNQTKKVKAEYTGFAEKNTAIMIMAGPDVEFEYPNATTDLALWVGHSIGENVKDVRFIDQEKIDDFMREDLDWYKLSMAEIGKELGADRVLYLDLIRYTMKEEHSVNLLRGNIEADVRVYEIGADSDRAVYQTEVSALFPEHTPLPVSYTHLRAHET